MAVTAEKTGVQAALSQALTFDTASERYGIPIDVVREIIEFTEPTRVPLMPQFILGVINLRGAVVPVIDLSARFGLGGSTIGKKSCIVIIEVPHEETTFTIGVLVDVVCEVIDLAPGDLEPAPKFGSRIRAEFIQGMARRQNGFMIVLDISEVLDMDQLVRLANDAHAGAA